MNNPILSTFLFITILNFSPFPAFSRNLVQTHLHDHFLNASFSLPLHPRSAIHKPSHKDYEASVRARLARDAARVQFLNRKLELALNRGKSLDNSMLQPNALTTPVISGHTGEYFARISVGQPARPFYLVPDTGSDVTWLQCLPCSNCYKQIDPRFDPKSSSSYKPLSCNSQQCQTLNRPECGSGVCNYRVNYGDGSSTVGDLATETLTFGNSDSVSNLAIGCGHDNGGLFANAAGIIGLGGGALSLTSQLKSSSFSYCLVDQDSDSSSTLEFNSVRPSDSLTTQLVKNPRVESHRYIKLAGITVGGTALPISPARFEIDESGLGGIIVDSGTTITQLPSDVYESLRNAFVKLMGSDAPPIAVGEFDTCYDLGGQPSHAAVPAVAFEFSEGNSLVLPGKNILMRMHTAGTYCLAFHGTTLPLSIIGNFQQQGLRVTYDLVNSVVGFSPNKC